MLKGEVHYGARGDGLHLPERHRRVDDQFLVYRPEHQVGKGHPLALVHVVSIREVILAVGQVGLHLNDVGMALLAELLLPLRLFERLLSDGDLLLIDPAEALVVHHIVVGLHHRQADIGFHLLLPGVGNQEPGLRNLVVVHCLEAVEEVVTGAHAVIVMERRRVEIRIGLRIDASAEVVIGVGVRTDLRGKQLQRSIPPVNLRIAGDRLLDADLRGIGDGVLHTVPERHHPWPVGHTLQRRNGVPGNT